MSLRWKSELVATLGPQRCDVAVQPGLVGLRSTLQTSGTGDGVIAIAAALHALRAKIPTQLPKTASLNIADEYVYYALLPATVPWSQRQAMATQYFAESLGRQDLTVRISLVGAGRLWLAAAVEEPDRLAWAQPFTDTGIALRSICPALLRDLRRIAGEVPNDGVLVMVRQYGVMLLLISGSDLVQLQWERCDHSEFEQRVEVFVRSVSTKGRVLPVVVFTDEWITSDTIRRAAATHRWRELRRGAAAQSLRASL